MQGIKIERRVIKLIERLQLSGLFTFPGGGNKQLT